MKFNSLLGNPYTISNRFIENGYMT